MKQAEFLLELVARFGEKKASNIIKHIPQESYRGISFQEWSETFVGAYVLKNPNRPHVISYMCKAIGKTNVEWDDMTRPNLSAFTEFLKGILCPNSVIVYTATVKSLLNEYSELGVIPSKGFAKSLTTKRLPSQNVALTEDEMDAIADYVPQSETEADVKRMMLLEMWTGARGSDTKSFTSDNIREGRLTYVSKKTKMESSIPVHSGLERVIRQKQNREHDASVVNRVVRRICKNCGITQEIKLLYRGKMRTAPKYEFITLHSCRRSFCTALSMRGVPTSIIQQFAGHTTQQMTERYIVADTTKLDSNTLAFFA